MSNERNLSWFFDVARINLTANVCTSLGSLTHTGKFDVSQLGKIEFNLATWVRLRKLQTCFRLNINISPDDCKAFALRALPRFRFVEIIIHTVCNARYYQRLRVQLSIIGTLITSKDEIITKILKTDDWIENRVASVKKIK